MIQVCNKLLIQVDDGLQAAVGLNWTAQCVKNFPEFLFGLKFLSFYKAEEAFNPSEEMKIRANSDRILAKI